MSDLPRVLVADPPWKFGDKLPGPGRGADKHYPTMTVDDLLAFAIPEMQFDAHLFLWRVASMQQEALDVAKAWGFTVKSEIVWLKRTKNGKRHFGMGRHVRMEHEIALICTRGKGAGILDKSVRSTFTTGLYLDDEGGGSFEAEVGRHSRKPDEFFDIVASLCAGPYAEIFAREDRAGWSVYGDEIFGGVSHG